MTNLNKCIYPIEKYILSDFQFGVESLRTTSNLLIVLADRNARLVAFLDYSSRRIWHKKGYAGLLYKLSSYWILVVFLASFLHVSVIMVWVLLQWKTSLEFHLYVLFLKAFIPLLVLILGSILLPHKWSSWCYL